MNGRQRRKIVDDVFTLVKLFQVQDCISRRCLTLAELTCRVLCECGERGIIQAGSCSWPRLRKDQDDGVQSTHFTYEWNWNAATRRRCAACLNADPAIPTPLPELHCWAALPERGEIVDLSTRYVKSQCRRLLGLDWPGDEPPEFLWCDAETLPQGVVYRADPKATLFVLRLLHGRKSGHAKEKNTGVASASAVR